MMKKWYLGIFVTAIVLTLIGIGLAKTCWIVKEPKKVAVVPFPTIMSKQEVIQASLVKSNNFVQSAIKRLNEHKLDDAIRDLTTAVDMFPLNTQAYQLLVKTHLMTGHEDRLYEALEKAGRSYPNFDAILNVIEDQNLDRIALPVETASAYVAAFKGHKKGAVSFMFDDGEANVYTSILPIFDRFNYKATISVVPSLVKDAPGDMYWGSWPEWKDAAGRGFEIANHSMHHRDAKTYTPDDMKVEIRDAQVLIDQKLGTKTSAYVFPMDSFTDDALRYAVRTHEAVRRPSYLRTFYARSVDIMYGGPAFSLTAANRLIDLTIKRNLWLVAEGHGLEIKDYTKNYKPLTVPFIEEHLAYVKTHDQDIWVDTFSNVFDYLSLRHAASVERKDVVPGQASVVLHVNGRNNKLPQPLTVVLKVPEKTPLHVAASTENGVNLKSWICGDNLICVDMDLTGKPVQVRWGNKG